MILWIQTVTILNACTTFKLVLVKMNFFGREYKSVLLRYTETFLQEVYKILLRLCM